MEKGVNGIFIADVGDGVCMALSGRKVIQIDAGGDSIEKSKRGIRKIVSRHFEVNGFILSHFHYDHYKGIVASVNWDLPPLWIRNVYFPFIPLPPAKRKKIFYAMETINKYFLGKSRGIMEIDLMKAISKLNHHKINGNIHPTPLWKGKSIPISTSTVKVVWPPRTITEKDFKGKIGKALQDFQEALKIGKVRRIYKKLLEEKKYNEYFRNEHPVSDVREELSPSDAELEESPKKVLTRANDSLRAAANHFSLAFYTEDEFLFLGDLEEYELDRVAETLKHKGQNQFQCVIAPHHGTHWSKKLEAIIEYEYILSSCGSKRYPDLEAFHQKNPDTSFTTYLSGDIYYPLLPYKMYVLVPIGVIPFSGTSSTTAMAEYKKWKSTYKYIDKLDSIKGISSKTIAKITNKFPTTAALRKAEESEVEDIKGIAETLGTRIYKAFHGGKSEKNH